MLPSKDDFMKMRGERGMGAQPGFISRLLGAEGPTTKSPSLQSRMYSETMQASPHAGTNMPVEQMRETLIQMIMQVAMQGGMQEGMMENVLQRIQEMDEQELRMFYRSFMEGFEGRGEQSSPEMDLLERYKAAPHQREEEQWQEPGFLNRLLGR